MKITERRLRKLIRNVINENYDSVPTKPGIYTKYGKHVAGNLWDLLGCRAEASEWLMKNKFTKGSKPYDILLNKIAFGNYGPMRGSQHEKKFAYKAGIYYGGYDWNNIKAGIDDITEDTTLKSKAAYRIVNQMIRDLDVDLNSLARRFDGKQVYEELINSNRVAYASGGSGPNNPPVNLSRSGSGPNNPSRSGGIGSGPNNPPINLPGSGKGPNNTNYFGGPGGQIKGPKPPTPKPVDTNAKRKAKREAHGYIMPYDEAMDFIRDMVENDSDYRYLRYVLNGSHNAFRNPRNPDYIFNIYVDEMQEMTLGCWVYVNQDSYQNALASAERFVKIGTSMTGQFDCSNHMTAIELFVDFRSNYEYGFPKSFA